MSKQTLKNKLNNVLTTFSNFKRKDKEIQKKIKEVKNKVVKKRTDKKIEEVRKEISQM